MAQPLHNTKYPLASPGEMPLKTTFKAVMAAFFLTTAPVAALADDDGHRQDNGGSSYSSSLPAPGFSWLTLEAMALGCGAVMLRRKYAKSR